MFQWGPIKSIGIYDTLTGLRGIIGRALCTDI